MKYNSGDVVMVRGDLSNNRKYDGVSVNTEMLNFRNQCLTIKAIGRSGDVLFYHVKECTWVWTDEMLISHINREETIESVDSDIFTGIFI